jgi:hypothetical protein
MIDRFGCTRQFSISDDPLACIVQAVTSSTMQGWGMNTTASVPDTLERRALAAVAQAETPRPPGKGPFEHSKATLQGAAARTLLPGGSALTCDTTVARGMRADDNIGSFNPLFEEGGDQREALHSDSIQDVPLPGVTVFTWCMSCTEQTKFGAASCRNQLLLFSSAQMV